MPVGLIVTLAIAAAIFGATYAFKWLIVPLILKSRHRHSNPTYLPVSEDDLTPELRDFIGESMRGFFAEKFEILAHVAVTGAVKNVNATSMLLVNRATGEVANVITTLALGLRSTVYYVRTHFADGTNVTTGFNRAIGVYPPPPNMDAMFASFITSPQAAIEFHRRRVRGLNLEHAAKAPPVVDGMDYMEDERRRMTEWFVECGYNYVESATGDMRQTFKGSYLMAWKLMEPVKSWRIRRRDAKTRRVWNAVGMDQWRPSGQAAAATAPKAASPPPRVAESVQSSQYDASGLRYEIRLAPGDVRRERTDAGTTLRIGMPTLAAQLGRAWRTILSLVFFAAALAMQLWITWMNYQMALRFGPPFAPRWPGYFSVWLCVMLGIVLYDIYKLVRIVALARGTIVLTATHAGLTYHNVQAWSGSGFVPREQIESLRVLRVPSMRGTSSSLLLRRVGASRRLTLFRARTTAAAEDARRDLAQALGIERTVHDVELEEIT